MQIMKSHLHYNAAVKPPALMAGNRSHILASLQALQERSASVENGVTSIWASIMFSDIYSGLTQLVTAKRIKDNRIFGSFICDIEKYFNREAPALLMHKESKLTYVYQKIERGRLAAIELLFESLRRDKEPRCAALVSFPPVLLLPLASSAQVSVPHVSV